MQFAYVMSVLSNLLVVCWLCNGAIEKHVCKVSMGLQKLKFDKVMSLLQGNWFMVSVRPSSYGCTCKVAKHARSWSRTRLSPDYRLLYD